MGKGTCGIGLGVVAVSAIVVFLIIIPNISKMQNFAISGYDGLTATWEGIDYEHSMGDVFDQRKIGTVYAEIDPIQTGIELVDPTGLRGELGQPQYVSTLNTYDNVEVTEDDGQGNKITETWKAQLLRLKMSVTITTSGFGVDTIYDVTFWIHLAETSTSVFTGSDDSRAYIIAVATGDKVEKSGYIDVSPTAGGLTMDTTSLSDEPVPQWLLDSGYTGELKNFKEVKFPLLIREATPQNILTLGRVESYSTWDPIYIEVLLFGYWKQLEPFRQWSWPDPLDWLWSLISSIGVALWIILGVILSVVAVVFAPGKYKLYVLIAVWVVVWLFGLGGLAMLTGGLG